MQNIKDILSKILCESKAAPILFVGSGMSKRYLGADDWASLLERFSTKLSKEYKFYTSKSGNALPKVATMIAEEFYDIWWSSEAYAEQRKTYENEIKNYDSPLKIEISSYLKNIQMIEDGALQTEIGLLKEVFKKGVIDTIITTNWDRFLEEEIFTDYDVLIGQDELLASGNIGLEEIHKIHGCVSSPNSLVLTAEDYNNFNEKNAYMAAKLLTSFIEHPIVFLGYSLNDESIQRILVNIGKCLPDKHVKKLENNLIFVQPIFDSSEDEITHSSITIDDVNIPRIVVSVNSYCHIYNALLDYERKFPTKLVKLMEKQLYQIVIENNSNNQIIAGSIDNLSQISEADFVVGMGINRKIEESGIDLTLKGISGLDYDQILDDIINDSIVSEGSPNLPFVQEIVKNILPKKPHYPIFKYLYLGGYDREENLLELDEKIVERINKTYEDIFILSSYSNKKIEIQSTYKSINDINVDGQIDEAHKILYIPLLLMENIDIEELKDFINDRLYLLKGENNCKSNFRKLIRLFDWLKYRKYIKKWLF